VNTYKKDSYQTPITGERRAKALTLSSFKMKLRAKKWLKMHLEERQREKSPVGVSKE
jgi:hypothetical protein